MLTIEITGEGAKAITEALTRGLDDLGSPPAELETRGRSGEDDRADPLAVATFALAIPPAILACWDLAERIKKIEALRRWLGLLPAGASVAVTDAASGKSAVLTAGGGPDKVDAAQVAKLIDIANASPQRPAWDVFLAYAGPDAALAEELYGALRSRGLRTFLDRRELRAGEPWDFQLINAQASARGTVVLLSPNGDKAWYQREELQRAIALRRTYQRFLIPLYRDGRPSDPGVIPYGLYHLEPLDLPGCGGIQGAAARIRDLVGGN